MSRAKAATRPAKTLLVAGLLLACPLGLARAQSAPTPDGGTGYGGDWLRLTTEGTSDHVQPRATVRLERPAHVAVFEVEPGVGATLLHPSGADRQARLSEGRHTFRLNGIQQAFNRRTMLAHLSGAFVHRDPVVLHNHLVAVASTRPLELGGLLSGRIFEHSRGFAGTEEVAGALLAEILGDRPAGAWTLARASYPKFRNEPLLFAARDLQADAPYLVLGTELQLLGLEADPRIPELVTCLFGAETLGAFHHGLGAVGPDVDCRRRLKALDVPGVDLPATIASAPGSGAGHDRTAGGPSGPGDPGVDRSELLARVADAGRSLGRDAGEELERLGVELRRDGAAVPLERMRSLRGRTGDWRSAVRARAERLRRARGIGLPRGRTPPPPGVESVRPAAGRGGAPAPAAADPQAGDARPDARSAPPGDRPRPPARDGGS